MWSRHPFVISAALAAFVTLAGSYVSPRAMAEEPVPEGFVYLRDVDSTIVQDIRYDSDHNFMGRRVRGYQAPECILTEPAARGLKNVQAELREKNLSLKVYDCYRPQRAVDNFVEWARDLNDTVTRAEFYPTIGKDRLFELGYIASKSGHSRGSTMDLTIVPLPTAEQPGYDPHGPLQPCTNPTGQRYADNSLDFGTGYDCFDPLSHTENPNIAGKARAHRMLLVDVMSRNGFTNYDKEWWHFTLNDEPYPDTFFDFPIVVRQID